MAGHSLLNFRGPAKKGKPFGYLFDLRRWDSKYLGYFPNRRSAAESYMVGYHGGTFSPVGALHKVEHLIPLVPGKINVNVGKIPPIGTEKPAEEELVADRIYVGDAKQVTHQTCGSTAAATGDG
jgi:hypothetical protein